MKSSAITGSAAKLGGQAIFFFAGNVFTLLLGLPLQIYVARNLGPDALGVFGLMDAGVAFVTGLAALGIAPTLMRFIPLHLAHGEPEHVRRLVVRGLAILLASNIAAYLLLLLALPYLLQWWPGLIPHRSAVIVMGLMIPLTGVCFYLQQGLRGFQEIRHMVLGSSFLQLTVKAFLTVIALSLGFHLLGYVVAVVVSFVFSIGWLGWALWRRVARLPSRESQGGSVGDQEWVRYAKVMFTGGLLGLATVHLDRFILGAFAGSATVGVLMVVKQLEQMPVIFLQMFLVVVAPMFAMAHASSDSSRRDHLYKLTTDWVVRLSAPLFVFFFVFAEAVLGLYGREFVAEGVDALRIFLAGEVINLCFGPVGLILNMSGSERPFLRITVIQSALLIVATIVLLPIFGLLGAALATTLSTVFGKVAAYAMAKRRLGLVWFDRRYLRWIAPTFVCVALGLAFSVLGPATPGALPLLGYLVCLYGAFHAVALIQGLHEDDLELLRHLAGRIFAARV